MELTPHFIYNKYSFDDMIVKLIHRLPLIYIAIEKGFYKIRYSDRSECQNIFKYSVYQYHLFLPSMTPNCFMNMQKSSFVMHRVNISVIDTS